MHSGGREKRGGVLASFSPGAQGSPQPSPLTGPETAVGAYEAHDDATGHGPGERRHRGERPFHV